MPKLSTIEAQQVDSPKPAVTMGAAPANQNGAVAQRETLDTLVTKHGHARPVFVQVAFAGYDPVAGLERGREVATERILMSVPGFVVSTVTCWASLGDARRMQVVGYTPEVLPVLLAETVTLRGLNTRYDVIAHGERYNRAACEGAAKDALRDGRVRGEQVLRMAQRYAPVPTVKERPLPAFLESAQDPAALALAIDSLAAWLDAWAEGWSDEVRAAYHALGFNAALPGELRRLAASIRDTQAVVAALSDTARVSQRELDEHDGRVLHLVGAIYAAFRLAARSDEGVVLPELGELESVFERASRRRVPDEPAPPAPAPQPG